MSGSIMYTLCFSTAIVAIELFTVERCLKQSFFSTAFSAKLCTTFVLLLESLSLPSRQQNMNQVRGNDVVIGTLQGIYVLLEIDVAQSWQFRALFISMNPRDSFSSLVDERIVWFWPRRRLARLLLWNTTPARALFSHSKTLINDRTAFRGAHVTCTFIRTGICQGHIYTRERG